MDNTICKAFNSQKIGNIYKVDVVETYDGNNKIYTFEIEEDTIKYCVEFFAKLNEQINQDIYNLVKFSKDFFSKIDNIELRKNLISLEIIEEIVVDNFDGVNFEYKKNFITKKDIDILKEIYKDRN